LTVGLLPLEANPVKTPAIVTILGWPNEAESIRPLSKRWALAESAHRPMFGRYLPAERDERAAP